MFGVFLVKNHDFTQKIHIFSNFRGGCVPPLESAPDIYSLTYAPLSKLSTYNLGS